MDFHKVKNSSVSYTLHSTPVGRWIKAFLTLNSSVFGFCVFCYSSKILYCIYHCRLYQALQEFLVISLRTMIFENPCTYIATFLCLFFDYFTQYSQKRSLLCYILLFSWKPKCLWPLVHRDMFLVSWIYCTCQPVKVWLFPLLFYNNSSCAISPTYIIVFDSEGHLQKGCAPCEHFVC